jgi:SAM-dependent methyltransferase
MPLMQYKEILVIKELLERRRPITCLEWGAGYSTLYFYKYLGVGSRWISIEHDKLWFEKIKQLIPEERVSIYFVPPNQWPPTDPYGDGSLYDFIDYVEFPKRFNEKFDFILIDGRARKFCLMKAFELLKDDGIVVLHDANRRYYHESFKLYTYQVLFQDSRQDGGLWIGSKNLAVGSFIDITKHRINWTLLKDIEKLDSILIKVLIRRRTRIT